MSDALTPLRRAYGVEVPGASAAGAAAEPGAGGHAEAVLLAQTRTAVEATVAAQDRQPGAAALDAVLAEAARASSAALAPLAAVRALYKEPTDAAANAVEAAILSQSRAAIEQAIDASPARPPSSVLGAILAEAAAATARAPQPDAGVEAPALAPLAIAYGLPLAAGASPDSVETQLLVQSRRLLDDRPVPAGPSDAAIAAVLARAASFGTPPVAVRPAAAPPAIETPVAAPAADRTPVQAARSYRRVGAWTTAAALAVALVVAFLPRTAGAPEVPVAVEAATVAATLTPAAEDETPGETPAAATPAEAQAASAAPLAESFAMLTPPPAAPAAQAPAIQAPAIQAPAARAPVAVQPQAMTAPPAAPPPATAPRRVEAPRPAPSRPMAPRAAAEPPAALAAADVTPADDAWDAPSDVRVLSLRLQALGRGNAGLAWDAPAEAFGAPATSTVGRATPGLQSVRETAPARVRLRTEPATGDR